MMFTVRTPKVQKVEVNEDELTRMIEEDYNCKVVELDFDEYCGNSQVLVYLDKKYDLKHAQYILASKNGVQNVAINSYNLKTGGEASMLTITLDGQMYNENEEGW